ncbi:MAG: hypothetical protein LBK61_06725, partial [Spirochaetaceae bacterium]|nr:hypothetical protein [Spirochaetaceae bacterium]
MTITQAAETGDTPSAKTVWMILEQVAEQHRETERTLRELAEQTKENDRKLTEQMKENDRKLTELHAETERAIKATNKQIGRLGGRYGEMVEAMVMPNLVDKFRKMGYAVNRASRGSTIEDRENGIAAEIDITLENGGTVIIVEVKSKPTTEDVNDHVKRMEKVRRHANLHGDRRTFLGAVAGMVVNDD